MTRPIITAEALRARMSYDAETGIFTWLNGPKAGRTVGSRSRKYLYTNFGGYPFPLHRLAWLHVHGSIPEGVIDHVNGDGCDNRLCNLRLVTQGLNAQNMRRAHRDNLATGMLGVSPNGKRFMAKICVKGRQIYLGQSDTPEEAHQVYLEAKRRLHPGCTI